LAGSCGLGIGIAESAGLTRDRFVSIMSLTTLLFCIPSIYLVDHFGRRPLLAGGALTMLVASAGYGALGVVFAEQVNPYTWTVQSPAAGVGILACIFLLIAGFSISWGPVVWAYCAEIFPLQHRSRCLGATTATNWFICFLMGQLGTFLYTNLGFFTGFFQVAILCACLVLACWLPETRGVELEEIDVLFRAKFRSKHSSESKDEAVGDCSESVSSCESTSTGAQ